jgi:hemerythrin-like metal-binding protein
MTMHSIDIFPWDDNFNTGLPTVDEQHQKLVQLLNLLASQVAFKLDTPQLSKIFDELADYTVYHFATEEAIWHAYLPGDDAERRHLETHKRFVQTVLRLKNELAEKPVEQVADEALSFLARWLASHILETDRHMAYAVLAMKSGMELGDAKVRAREQMSGATRVLIDIILSIYDTLSSNTLQLMREIAERKRNEEILQQARLSAEAANVAKSRFLANMSHEIRTPLNGILGMAQLLQASDVSEEERIGYAQTIADSGQTLLALLNDILDLAKVEDGKLELGSAVFDLRQFIDEVRTQFAGTIEKKGLKLASAVAGLTANHYRSDPQRLRQMLANLLSNAIKFTEHGQIRINVSETGRSGEAVILEFSVTDTGIGIPAEKRSLLFQPFSQVDDSTTRRYDGSGLGLSLVRSLAELMGGEVGVDSEPGKGSRFWFRIHAAVIE